MKESQKQMAGKARFGFSLLFSKKTVTAIWEGKRQGKVWQVWQGTRHTQWISISLRGWANLTCPKPRVSCQTKICKELAK